MTYRQSLSSIKRTRLRPRGTDRSEGLPVIRSSPACFMFMLAMLLLAGCQSYVDPSVPVAIRPVVEPEFQQQYLLYRPSNYDRNMAWPLMVVCAAGFPDSPDQQIRDWTQLAERNGFLAVAPQVRGNRPGMFTNAADASAALLEDERRILATIRHVQAAYTISDDRIFIYGWAAGAQPAIYTGLRHPELFRAVAVFQPKIGAEALAEARRSVDSHQAVLVYTNATDAIWGHPSGECVTWLRNAGSDVTEDPTGPARRTDGARAVDFFDRVIRSRPWIHIVATPTSPTQSSEFRFQLRASSAPVGLRWRFGDGGEASVAEPVHAYAKPGTYRVEVELRDAQGKTHERTTEITVRP